MIWKNVKHFNALNLFNLNRILIVIFCGAQVRSYTTHTAGAAEEHPATFWWSLQTVSVNVNSDCLTLNQNKHK